MEEQTYHIIETFVIPILIVLIGVVAASLILALATYPDPIDKKTDKKKREGV